MCVCRCISVRQMEAEELMAHFVRFMMVSCESVERVLKGRES